MDSRHRSLHHQSPHRQRTHHESPRLKHQTPHCLSPHCLSPHCLSPHCLSLHHQSPHHQSPHRQRTHHESPHHQTPLHPQTHSDQRRLLENHCHQRHHHLQGAITMQERLKGPKRERSFQPLTEWHADMRFVVFSHHPPSATSSAPSARAPAASAGRSS